MVDAFSSCVSEHLQWPDLHLGCNPARCSTGRKQVTGTRQLQQASGPLCVRDAPEVEHVYKLTRIIDMRISRKCHAPSNWELQVMARLHSSLASGLR